MKFSLDGDLEVGELVYCDSVYLNLINTKSVEATLRIMQESNF